MSSKDVNTPKEVVKAVQDVSHALPPSMFHIKPEVLLEKLKAGDKIALIDVRRPDEFAAGHIAAAVNLPVTEIADHPELLPAEHDAFILAYCRSGTRSAFAASALRIMGYSAAHSMTRGLSAWEAAGYAIEH